MKQRGRKGPLKSEVFARPHLVSLSPTPEEVPPPPHLGPDEQRIWRNVLREFKGTDASLALLVSGLEAHQRARQCRQTIDEQGMTVEGTAGQMKAHPLLTVERAAWRAFSQTFKMLGLKV
jgi:P27 family predicted phage terminase small subunit